ncbi:hydantoinase/oxoprolinase family protein [Nocardioides marmoriginsengisoli]|uniref:Hydantoinase/oxoprolinase family protein n=1 Tax=Nocardioides marmoriginsengisoli TaxID=661483 RepID=A0A3N0CH29_9ACTN|nr:hydantoinase/oxoprolinase family protein [Nocardioides marmoriginsengisoli]RNL62599.1 hydantoinase/oxoprolinase family protein [Nocardioides marmoriginsengisoli]
MPGSHDLRSSGWRVGADIGGTFTDVIALGPAGEVVPMKVPSTPPDYGAGVVSATMSVLAAASVEPRDVVAMLHGTTVATNAILSKNGALTAVVTTRGFRDVLEIGRLRRPSLYDLSWSRPEPLARRRHRYELDQRITSGGLLEPAAEENEVRALASRLRADGIEAVAVCLLNSYVRPDEERRVADLLRAELPGVYVTASVDVSPQLQEYERTSTAAVNSYVGPAVHGYLTRLEAGLRNEGVVAPLLVMQSSGGLMDAGSVAERPVQIIESGPAAGVTAVQKLAEMIGLSTVVAFDMGGTTAKASLIEDGEPFVSADYEVGGGMNIARGLASGAGYPVRAPSIDIAEVGSGGGSIIAVDPAGALHVGPSSAGSRPGPACYGHGGELPTLTDANVTLGYLSQTSLAGGTVTIHPDLAAKALAPVADQLGADVQETARGAYQVAVSNMTTAVKAVTSERGRDPRDATMVAFGGAGPLYAASLARELGITTVIVPVYPGLFSSLGLLVADTEHHELTSYRPEHAELRVLAGEFDRLAAKVVDELGGDAEIDRLVDMRYRGQRFELRVRVPDGELTEELLAETRARFHAEHQRTYGRVGADDLVELVNLRVRGWIPTAVAVADVLDLPADPGRAAATRSCRFDELVATPVIGRADLGSDPVEGPLVIEDMDATTLVPPGARVFRDRFNNIVITWSAP